MAPLSHFSTTDRTDEMNVWSPKRYFPVWIPPFGVLDIWWVESAKMHTIGGRIFHWYRWLAEKKTFSCRLCLG